MEAIFEQLVGVIQQQQKQIESIAEKLSKIESIGGGGGGTGNAVIEDYQENHHYMRNTLVVDPNMETVYRVLREYTSVDLDTDCANADLKLVGYESQVITFPHNPTQKEIDALPDDVLVAVYSPTDAPYVPDSQE